MISLLKNIYCLFFFRYHFIKALKRKSFFLIIFSLCALATYAQKNTKIELITANSLEYSKNINKDVRRLIGDVILKHDQSLMYCDSAYLYSESNKFDAFGKIHIKASDSVDVWGDFLKYDGNTKLAELNHNCKMVDNQSTLTSDYMFYDMENDIAYYNSGGKIINAENNLTSKIGRYYSKDKMFFFKDSVVLVNPKYTINSDTLKYNTVSEISYFLGPTTIVSKENTIYCENGWYDSKNDLSQFNKNASLKNKDQVLKGDSIFYDRTKGYGKAIKNVTITDLKENLVIYGDFGEYFEKTEFTQVTQKPYLIKVFDNDSLFLHADTLNSKLDSVGGKRILFAFRHVKFFKSDLQGISDSVVFFFRDSTVNLYGNPVIWNDQNQLSADFIKIIIGNNTIKELQMYASSFIVSENDSLNYDQIKGKDMVGYFDDSKLHIIDVKGNGQTVYHVNDDDGSKTGINTSESSSLRIYLKDNKVEKIQFKAKPDATLYPIKDMPEDKKLLKGFRWLKNLKPIDKNDIFIWRDLPVNGKPLPEKESKEKIEDKK